MRNFRKDPDEVLEYTVNWSRRLLTGETIVTSEWVIKSAVITKDSSSLTSDAATIWLSGGTAGSNYIIVNRVQTSANRVYEQAFRIECIDSRNR